MAAGDHRADLHVDWQAQQASGKEALEKSSITRTRGYDVTFYADTATGSSLRIDTHYVE